MIRAKRLRELLAMLPDDARLWAYDGMEGVGIGFQLADGRHGFIYASEDHQDEDRVEGLPL